ncbi:MAG: alpha/beta fold hydrolase [Gemmatimonadaceae bacterium]
MRVEVGTRGIAYDDAGEGTPVLFVHGFPHHRKLWAPQMRALAGHCRVIAVDLPGFGESDMPERFSIEAWADGLARFLDVLGIDRAVITGLSMGGYITLALWRLHRERVVALVLSDTRAGADSEEGKAKRRETIELARREGPTAVARAMLPGMVGKSTREREPSVMATMRAMLEGASVDSIVGASEAMIARADSASLLATIDVPTLIVVGDEDVLTPPKESRAMHAAIPGSQLEIIPGAGHVSNIERPAAWNQVFMEFLARMRASE